MKSIYKKMVLFLFGILTLTACKDNFLDRPPQSQISTENFYQTKQEIRLATAALYGGETWSQWNNSAYLPLGDILAGNSVQQYQGIDLVQLNTFTLSGANNVLITAWTGLYIVVAHANLTIKGIQENAPATVTEADKNAGIAEARFIRAMAYYHLTMLWGEVPIIEDNTLLVTKPLVNKHKQGDVFQFIVNDLTFASTHLPATDEKGRVTKWSAKGLLSKVYLTLAGFEQSGGGTRSQTYLDLAKTTAMDVIQNSGLELLPDYANLFKSQFNDNSESLFALQWAATTEWMQGNHLLTHSPSKDINPRQDGAWSPMNPSYDLYLDYNSADLRRKPTIMLPGDHYPELNAAKGGYTATGIAMKKHIIGNEADNNTPAMHFLGSIEHNSLLRLADVYLIYAEAVLGNNASTTDATALLYFNKVRTRAGLSALTSLNMDVILKERRVEFAYEGHYWYDLVRLSYYNPQSAISKLNNQQRVMFSYNEGTGVATPNDPIGAITPATISTFTLELPSSELTANPKLAEPAVPYFTN
jgi:starch-binding outer membrane protein, SusD/RagB family